MGGRTSFGVIHESECEFPWFKCTCAPAIQLEELSIEASQKLEELTQIFKTMKELKDGQHQA